MVISPLNLLVALGCGTGAFSPLVGAEAMATQDPVSVEEAEEYVEAVRTLKARKLAWDKKLDAMDTLLASGPDGCVELTKHLSKACQSLDAAYLKDWKRIQEDFEKTAKQVAASRLDKKAVKRIDELRATWLTTSRSKDLSKAQVHDICDKAHEEIQQFMDVAVVDVWEDSPKLEERWNELVFELDDLLLVHDYLIAARAELLKDPKNWGGKSFVKKLPPDPTLYEESAFKTLDRAVRLATVMPERDVKTILANESDFPKLDADEIDGIIELNRIRVRAGLSTLRVDFKLCQAGRGHSQDMVENEFFAHESPIPGKKTPSDRAAKAGTSGGAENIAAGQQTGLGAISAWWYSPGHHRNMMGNHSRVGLGRFKNHWTQMFG
ncbi:MAG: CAP domain-containing protein [Planctomycetes bacterium]|nr:CAP domain-containing protein [Planctomycetota bacterium]